MRKLLLLNIANKIKTLIVAFSVLILITTLSSSIFPNVEAQSNLINFSKSGIDTTTNSTELTQENNIVKWIMSYNNNSGQIADNTEITDPNPETAFVQQTYLGGANGLKTPPTWSKNYSTDGGNTYTGLEPSNGVNRIKSTSVDVPSPATGVVGKFTKSLDITSTGSGGDGYTPINYPSTNKIFYIHHHMASINGIGGQISCTDKLTNATCTGYPKWFSSTDASGKDIKQADMYTSFFSNGVVIGSKVYVNVSRTNDNGIICFDLDNATNCGYIKLSDLKAPTATPSWGYYGQIDGLTLINNKLYSFASNAQTYCYDLSKAALCSGQPYSLGAGIRDITDFPLLMPKEIIDKKIYYLYNYADIGDTGKIGCFDTANNSPCNGWTVKTLPPNIDYVNLFLWPNPGINTGYKGICTSDALYFPTGTQCWSLADNSKIAAPAGFLANITVDSYAKVLDEYNLNNKVYFASWAGGYCYDFNQLKACDGFGANGYKDWGYRVIPWDGGPKDTVKDYGYTYDPASACMYGVGDAGYLWSFDPNSGATPCISQNQIEKSLTPEEFYCDGKPQTNISWGKIKVTGTIPNEGNLLVKIYDKNNGLVNSGSLKNAPATGYDFSSVNYNNPNNLNKTLRFVVTSVGAQSSDLKLSFLFNGNAPQFCYNVKVISCVSNKVTNNSTVKTVIGSNTYNSNAQASLTCPGQSWFTVNDAQSHSVSRYLNTLDFIKVRNPSNEPPTSARPPFFSNSIVSVQTGKDLPPNKLFYGSSDGLSNITSYQKNMLVNYTDTNASLVTDDYIQSSLNSFRSILKVPVDFDTLVPFDPKYPGIIKDNSNNITVKLSQVSDAIAVNTKGAVYIFNNIDDKNVTIEYDLTDTTTKTGLTFYIADALSLKVISKSSSLSTKSSVLLLSNNNISVESTLNGLNGLNMGLVTTGNVNYRCTSPTSLCKMRQYGFTFAGTKANIDYKNSDSATEPSLNIKYGANYINDFSKLVISNDFTTNLVGFDY